MAEDILRKIHITTIIEAIANGLKEANLHLPEDVVCALEEAYKHENALLPKQALGYILKNLEIAKNMSLPVCQDTGLVSVQVKVGQLVHIEGGSLEEGIQLGVKKAYTENSFRASVVSDPLFERKNTGDNTPAIVHVKFTEGNQLVLSCMPKGFGSENMSCLKMFSPSATEDDIVKFVVDAVEQAGANPCPPILLGIGIGGSFDYVAELAKEALMLPVGAHHPNEKYAIDQYEFKNYVKNVVGEGYTIPLIGVYNDVNDIDFSSLPNQFVIKTTANGSMKGVKVVKDLKNLNIDELKYDFANTMQEWNSVYYSCLSRGYKDIKPRIIIEE